MADTDYIYSLTNARFQEESCSSDTLSSYSITRGIWAGKTEFSDVVIAESPIYGNVLFLDKELQSAESDERIYHEHLVHPVMNATAHMAGKRVLIVGGGEGATAREVLKYGKSKVAHVSWIDIDGSLVDLCRRHLGWAQDSVYNDPRLIFMAMDIRTFLSRNTVPYDIIILDLPDPDVDSLRAKDDSFELYGRHFWSMLKMNLTTCGTIVTHVGPVAPGGNEYAYRAGLAWVQEMSRELFGSGGVGYHVNIPSFQSEWGFWMLNSCSTEDNFPDNLAVMDLVTQTQAFTWPNYWFSPYIGVLDKK